jgi:hypothetical protein
MKQVQVFGANPEIHFQVLSIEVLDAPAGIFGTELRTMKEGERYQIDVRVLEYGTDPTVRGRLRIVTDDPRAPDKEVRLFAQFGDPGQPAAGGSTTRPGAGREPLRPQVKERPELVKPAPEVAPKPAPGAPPPGR